MWLDNKMTGVGLNNYEEVCKNNKKYQTQIKKIMEIVHHILIIFIFNG